MTLELVKSEDCRQNRQKHKYVTIEVKEQVEQTEQVHPSSLPLIDKEDCSSIKKRWDEKLTKHQLGWAIRTGDIDIPKGDKRHICRFYNKNTRKCSEYKILRCSNCKKNRLPKDNYYWSHPEE